MSSRKGSPGFTLIELLVVTMISAIVMAGLGSILLTAVTTQIRAMRQSRAQMAASILTKQLERDVYQANDIWSPAVGVGGNELWAMIGRISSGVSPTGQSSYTEVYYCLSGTDLYYYSASVNPVGMVLTNPSPCGSGNAMGNWILKVGAPDLVVKPLNITGGIFGRDVSSKNVVHVSLQIAPSAGGMQAAPINVDLNMAAQFAASQP